MKNSSKVFFVGIVLLFLGIFIIFIIRLNSNNYDINQYLFSKTKRTKLIVEKGKTVNWSKTYSSDLQHYSLDGFFDVTVLPGDSNHVEVQADENVLPYLNFSLLENKLKIQLRPGFYIRPTQKVKVIITTNSVKKIKLNGNNLLQANKLLSDDFILSTEGTNEVHLQGEVKNLSMNIAGKAQLYINVPKGDFITLKLIGEVASFLSGKVTDMDIMGTGNFKIFAKDLIAKNIHVESVAAKSEMVLNAAKNLSVNTVGKSDISYYGNPIIKRNFIGTNVMHKM